MDTPFQEPEQQLVLWWVGVTSRCCLPTCWWWPARGDSCMHWWQTRTL